jgi:hypothetical protein
VDAELIAHVALDAAAAEQRRGLGGAAADEDVIGVRRSSSRSPSSWRSSASTPVMRPFS